MQRAGEQVGIREQGNNEGPQVTRYLRAAGLGPGYPWCAAMLAWVHEQCGIPGPRSAWSPDYFPADRVIYHRGHTEGTAPQPGDVLGNYYPSKERIAHVGFIARWPGGDQWVITIEGNTNDSQHVREGVGVFRKRVSKRQVYKVSRFQNPQNP